MRGIGNRVGCIWACGIGRGRRSSRAESVSGHARSASRDRLSRRARRRTIHAVSASDGRTGVVAFDGSRDTCSRSSNAGRAGRVAGAGVLEDRDSVCVHRSGEPARALLQRPRRGRLHSRRADPRDRLARSAAGRHLLHGGAGSRTRPGRSTRRMPRLPPHGEHARRARAPGSQHVHRSTGRTMPQLGNSSSTIAIRSSSAGAGFTSRVRTAPRVTWVTRWSPTLLETREGAIGEATLNRLVLDPRVKGPCIQAPDERHRGPDGIRPSGARDEPADEARVGGPGRRRPKAPSIS